MGLFKPSELKAFLRQQGIRPDKTLSQNFLIDGNIIRKIVEEAAVSPEDLVLEIGPGPGALTQALLQTGSSVLAVEKDTELAQALNRFKQDPTLPGALEVQEGDVMEFPVEQALRERLRDGQKAKVVANLPYHLTTPILRLLTPHHELISDVVVMVQDEVAQRMSATPHSREYNSLALFLDFFSDVKYAFKVSRNCFYPAPKVDSAISHLRLHPPCSVSDTEAFFKLTRTAFGVRRKMLRGSLKELYSSADVESALEQLGFPGTARPEELSLEAFMKLFEMLND